MKLKEYENLILRAEKYGLSSEILNSSIIHKGNNHRLKRFFEKARNGKSVTVGFLGGSITYGSNSTDDRCFANIVFEWLKEQFPSADIKIVNAGFGGTGSIIGFYRMDDELLKYNPDITFLDFTVNDALENKRDGIVPKESYESVIRRILLSDSALIVLGFCDVEKTTFRDLHLEIAKHYDLSMISMVDSIYSLVEKGELQWQDYSNDSVHPINFGHEMIAFLIKNFLLSEIESSTDSSYVLPDEIFERILDNPVSYDYFSLPTENYGSFEKYDGYLRLKNGFIGFGEHPISFKLNDTKELFLIILYSNDPNTGTAVVEVNGNLQKVNCMFKDGWGSKPLAINIFSSDIPKDLNVNIYPENPKNNIIILRICKS